MELLDLIGDLHEQAGTAGRDGLQDVMAMLQGGNLAIQRQEEIVECLHCGGTGKVVQKEVITALPDGYRALVQRIADIWRALGDDVDHEAVDEADRSVEMESIIDKLRDDPALVRNYWTDNVAQKLGVPVNAVGGSW